MFKFMNEQKATISLFLVTIMFSTMALSGIVIDGARMRAADSIAKSAGENAAVSTLAGYNATLKERYGLFAMNYESDDEATKVLKYYFESMLGSEVQNDELDSLISLIAQNSRFKDKKFLDMFRLSAETITANRTYPLLDPAVMRSQIMEYAKYRAPAFYAESAILDALNKTENYNEDMDLTNKYQTVSKNASSFLKKAEDFEKDVEKLDEKIKALKEKEALQSTHIQDFTNKKSSYEEAKKNYDDAVEERDNANKEIQEKYSDITGGDTVEDVENKIQEKKVELENIEKDGTKTAEEKKKEKDQIDDEIEKLENNKSRIETYSNLVNVVNNAKVSNKKTAMENAERNKNNALETLKNDKTDYANEINAIIEEIKRLNTTLSNLKTEKGTVKSQLSNFATEAQNNTKCSSDGDASTGKSLANQATKTKDKITAIPFDSCGDKLTESMTAAVNAKTKAQQTGLTDNTDMNAANTAMKNAVAGINTIDFVIAKETPTEKNKSDYENLKGKASSKSDEANKDSTDSTKTYYTIENLDGMPSHQTVTNNISEFYASDKAVTDKAQQYLGQMEDIDDYSDGTKKKVDIVIDGENTKENTADTSALFKALENAVTYAADSLVINEYIINMFKNRTTEIDYNNETGVNKVKETDRFAVKSKFNGGQENLRWDKLNSTNTKLKYGEVEYIIWGNESEKFNIDAVYSEILIMRMAINISAILLDSNAVNALSEISACAGPFAPAVFIALTAIWGTAESLVEMDRLVNKGYKIAFFKKSGSGGNMFLSLENLLNDSPGIDNSRQTDIMFSYEDYLRVRLILTPMNKRLGRIADLIQLNTGVKMNEAYTYIRVHSSVSMPFMFMTSAVVPAERRFEKTKDYKIENVFYQGY